MYKRIKKEKCCWLMVLLIVCWLMAGTVGYGQYSEDDEVEGPGVILYKHAEFKGSRIFLKAGSNIKDLKNMGWNDKISSIELVDNVYIRIYEHKNYRGASVTIYDDVFDLQEFSDGIAGSWNDKISSIKVLHRSRGYHKNDYYDEEDKVYCIFYKHANQRGSSFQGTPGNHRSIARRWNDEISSVWIRSGYQVTLYEHGKFKGTRLVLTGKGWKGSVYNLDNYGFNDIMSSYKLGRR